jgi:hypothetical protein
LKQKRSGFFIAIVFSLATHLLNSFEYFYPVGNLDHENFLVLHQKSIEDLELWMVNATLGICTKELSAFFLPSHVKLLPDKTGFSFIDRGSIRIKKFNKRAVQTLALEPATTSIISMDWIDQNQFYCTAQVGAKFALLVGSIQEGQAKLLPIAQAQTCDFLYPIPISHGWLCITKNSNNLYGICKIKTDGHEPEIIISSQESPLCFLHAGTDEKFYVLELINVQAHNQNCLLLCCCMFSSQNSSWEKTKLFEFRLAKKLLMGTDDQRVFESIYPFLPRYFDDYIFFMDMQNDQDFCQIKSFNTQTKTIKTLSEQQNQHIFSPVLIEHILYCGFSVSKNPPIFSESTIPVMYQINLDQHQPEMAVEF